MFLGSYGCQSPRGVATLCALALGVFLCLSTMANAQRVILNEDFESDAPDTFPNSADFFARSSIAPDPNLDPSTAVVTGVGGAFADPFAPGSNQSLILHNPDGTTQMAVTWTDEFMDDPATFVNGTIDFDLWMDTPDPNAFWTFLGVRIGHGDSARSGVNGSASETTTWNTYRLQNTAGGLVEQIVDEGLAITTGSSALFSDSVPGGEMEPDSLIHVKYEFIETSTSGGTFDGFSVYRLIVNGTTIVWDDGEDEQPWVFNSGGGGFAPGVNVLTFTTDASAHGQDPDTGTGNIYIDNLVIINDDLSPLNTDFNGDNKTDGADFLIWQRGFGNGTTLAEGDADGDADVDNVDLGHWEGAFGTATPLIGASVAIPEPSSFVLALSIALMHMSSSRRSCHKLHCG